MARSETTRFITSVEVRRCTPGTFAHTALRTRPAGARAISRIAGAAMVVIGLLQIIDRLTP